MLCWSTLSFVHPVSLPVPLKCPYCLGMLDSHVALPVVFSALFPVFAVPIVVTVVAFTYNCLPDPCTSFHQTFVSPRTASVLSQTLCHSRHSKRKHGQESWEDKFKLITLPTPLGVLHISFSSGTSALHQAHQLCIGHMNFFSGIPVY